jgi:glutamate racemase
MLSSQHNMRRWARSAIPCAVSLANNANFVAYKGDESAQGISVFAVGCPELVTLVERGELNGPLAERAVREHCSLD